MNELFFVYNNKFFRSGEPVISAGNRGLRYGDGLFETMRIRKGRILNAGFHFDRLVHGLSLLQFEYPKTFSPEFLTKKIQDLLRKNGHGENARIRLMVFRGDGGVFDAENHFPNYIIESWSLAEEIEWNVNGLVVDVFPDARKSCDQFSNLKSNNYLPSAMAALFAKKNKLNDAILLNVHGRICESSIANIFVIKDNNLYTPPLSEGCVAGVIRRWFLEKFSLAPYSVIEKELSVDDLLTADELFLTNSIRPLRWVKSFGDKNFSNQKTREIFQFVSQQLLTE
jgi:branched-chain amino acid aminotransferase